MSTALATMPNQGHAIQRTPDVVDTLKYLNELWDLAGILVKSRMLPSSINSTEAAVAIILKGRELGIGAMHAFDSISVIQGKPTISPQLMLALIERSGQLEDMAVEEKPEACAIMLKRRGRSQQTICFDKAEATSMGLWGKGNWLKMPAVMLYWRCVAKACRRVFPDVIAGCYTPDEMGAEVNEDGELSEMPAGQKFPDQGGGGKTGSYAPEAHDAAFKQMVTEAGTRLKADWEMAWRGVNGGDWPQGLPEMPLRSSDVIDHLFRKFVERGTLKPVDMVANESTGEMVPRASIEQLRKMVAIVYAQDPDGVKKMVGRFMQAKAMDVAIEFVDANGHFSLPDDFNPEFNVLDDGPAPEDESQDVPEPLPAAEPVKRLGKKAQAEAWLKAKKEREAAEAEAGQPDGEIQDIIQPGDIAANGLELLRWAKDQEDTYGIGMIKYLHSWAKLQEFPLDVARWEAEQVELAYKECRRKVAVIAATRADVAEEALSNTVTAEAAR